MGISGIDFTLMLLLFAAMTFWCLLKAEDCNANQGREETNISATDATAERKLDHEVNNTALIVALASWPAFLMCGIMMARYETKYVNSSCMNTTTDLISVSRGALAMIGVGTCHIFMSNGWG